jgi:predicted RNA polymerase sigma factor
VTDWRAVRRLVPEVLGALVRRYDHFDACEDAVQEALVAATAQRPVQGFRALRLWVAAHPAAECVAGWASFVWCPVAGFALA